MSNPWERSKPSHTTFLCILDGASIAPGGTVGNQWTAQAHIARMCGTAGGEGERDNTRLTFKHTKRKQIPYPHQKRNREKRRGGEERESNAVPPNP